MLHHMCRDALKQCLLATNKTLQLGDYSILCADARSISRMEEPYDLMEQLHAKASLQ